MSREIDVTVTKLEREFKRIGLPVSGESPINVKIDTDDLPAGWVCFWVGDCEEPECHNASDLLKSLSLMPSSQEYERPNDFFFVFEDVLEDPEEDRYEVPDAAWRTVQKYTDAVTASGELAVVEVEQNEGVVYCFAPTNERFRASGVAVKYSNRFSTPEEALKAAEEFEKS
jgi:hypothetical protein